MVSMELGPEDTCVQPNSNLFTRPPVDGEDSSGEGESISGAGEGEEAFHWPRQCGSRAGPEEERVVLCPEGGAGSEGGEGEGGGRGQEGPGEREGEECRAGKKVTSDV